MPPDTPHTGGRRTNPFVEKHFTRVGERHEKTKRFKMQCRYCPLGATIIEHRDTRCISHLSKYDQCPNAPDEVRREALELLAGPELPEGQLGVRGHELSVTPGPSDAGPSGSQVVPIDVDTDGPRPAKKQKTQTMMTSFVDTALTDAEKEAADYWFLRCAPFDCLWNLCC